MPNQAKYVLCFYDENYESPDGFYDFDLTVKATDGSTDKYSLNVPVYIKVEAPVFTTAIGHIVMTIAIALFAVAYIVGDKIMSIEV